MSNKISIAQVLKPQGIKGELKCKALTEKLELFANLSHVFCDNKQINVISSVYRLGYVYICLENVNTRDDAELYRNKTLYLSKEDYGDLGEDSYYIEDLVHCRVYDENEQEIGVVMDVENYGATDILVIKEGWQMVSVPFIKKVFTEIKPAENRLVVNTSEYNEHKC